MSLKALICRSAVLLRQCPRGNYQWSLQGRGYTSARIIADHRSRRVRNTRPCGKAQSMSISLRKQPHKPDRRNFAGGSDGRIIMGRDDTNGPAVGMRRPCCGFGARNAVRRPHSTSRACWSSSSAWSPRTSIDADMSSTLATGWVTSSATRSTGRSHCSINNYGQA